MSRDFAWTEAVNFIAEGALALTRRHDGRLCVLTVGIPPEAAGHWFRGLMETRLREMGLQPLELLLESRPGPMVIVSAEFERW